MYGTVSNATIAGMVVSLILAVGVPLVLIFLWKKMQDGKPLAAIVGAMTFFIAAMVVEQAFHMIVMNVVGQETLTSNVWIYGLYGGLAAAIFEEVGRLIAMRWMMKKSGTIRKQNGIMYGIGHGGMEAILIVGMAEVSNIATAFAVNGGRIDELLNQVPEQKDALLAQLTPLWTSPAYSFYLAGIERIFAIVLHIVMSYFVYRAVKYGMKYFAIAFIIHFLMDFGTVVISRFVSTLAVEAVLLVAAVVLGLVVAKMYKNEPDDTQLQML